MPEGGSLVHQARCWKFRQDPVKGHAGEAPRARCVRFAPDTLEVELLDGRTLSVPLDRLPRLARAAEAERSDWRLTGHGEGIRWDALEEEVEVIELISAGRPGGRRTSTRE